MSRPALLALGACALVLPGCGGGDSDSALVERTTLTITLDPDGRGGKPATEAEVECPGADSPPQICDVIEALPEDPAAPVPPDTPCTEIYGGPDVVTIEGTLRAEPIDARLTRENGCEIERFDRLLPLLAAVFPDYEPGAALGS